MTKCVVDKISKSQTIHIEAVEYGEKTQEKWIKLKYFRESEAFRSFRLLSPQFLITSFNEKLFPGVTSGSGTMLLRNTFLDGKNAHRVSVLLVIPFKYTTGVKYDNPSYW